MGRDAMRWLQSRATVRPSTAAREMREQCTALFVIIDVLFGTADSGGTGNEEGKEHFAPPDAPAAPAFLATPKSASSKSISKNFSKSH